MKEFTFGALLVAMALAFSLVVVEVALRIVKPRIVAVDEHPAIYEPDEKVGYRFLPGATGHMSRFFEIDNQIAINRFGFHDVERDFSRPGAFRIAVVGDSFTAALHVPVKKTWTQVAEKTINQSLGCGQVELVNLGLDATGTRRQATILESRANIIKPDMVMLAFYQNDVKDIFAPLIYRDVWRGHNINYRTEEEKMAMQSVVDQKLDSFFYQLHRHIFVVRAIHAFIKKTKMGRSFWFHDYRSNFFTPFHQLKNSEAAPIKRRGANLDKEEQKKELLAQIKRVEQVAAGRSAPFYIFAVPNRQDIQASRDSLLRNVPKEAAQALPILDMAKLIEDKRAGADLEYADLYWKHDGHFSLVGNQIIGQAVGEMLTAKIKERGIKPCGP